MSQENVEIVRREYVAFAARDWAALAEICIGDQDQALDPGTYRGHEEMRHAFMGWSEMFEEWWVEHGEILEVGDQVAVVERFGGTGMKGSGADVALEQSVARLVTFKDGQIWRVKEYSTLDRALEAAGLSEEARGSDAE